jgi:hypothetical protein
MAALDRADRDPVAADGGRRVDGSLREICTGASVISIIGQRRAIRLVSRETGFRRRVRDQVGRRSVAGRASRFT